MRMSDTSRPDGRRRRGEDNRAKIVEAMLALIRDGQYAPSAEVVATRADVSLRTVFRHFEDMDSLYREIATPVEIELRAMAARPFKATDWRGRVLEMVSRRSEGFERLSPFRRAADVHRHGSVFMAADAARFATVIREILRAQLPEHLREGDLFESLDLVLAIESWMRLRREQGLSVVRAREIQEHTVRRLLEGVD
jgi:AcrR family transcriptional regulator